MVAPDVHDTRQYWFGGRSPFTAKLATVSRKSIVGWPLAIDRPPRATSVTSLKSATFAAAGEVATTLSGTVHGAAVGVGSAVHDESVALLPATVFWLVVSVPGWAAPDEPLMPVSTLPGWTLRILLVAIVHLIVLVARSNEAASGAPSVVKVPGTCVP